MIFKHCRASNESPVAIRCKRIQYHDNALCSRDLFSHFRCLNNEVKKEQTIRRIALFSTSHSYDTEYNALSAMH